jgi:aspartate/methionine/tyrosine aminotransferase
MDYSPFTMERWQSTYEHRVRFNLSESGVHPLSVSQLLKLTDHGPEVLNIHLGYGQSNGSDKLRSRIADLYQSTAEDSVLVTTGGAEANFVAFWHLLDPEAPVAVMLPNYMQVPGLLKSFKSPILPYYLIEGDGWQPDLEALKLCLQNGARCILVTNPNNPTGAILSLESMSEIVRLAENYGAWILADEVYQGAEIEGARTPSFWGQTERVIVVNSLSKAYGLPGLRVGWVLAPPEIVESMWGRTDYTTISPSSLSDTLACIALQSSVRQKIFSRTQGIIKENFSLLAEWMASEEDRYTYRRPDAGAICYVRYKTLINSTQFAQKLRREMDILVVPGDHFGMDNYLRLGFGPPTEELSEALGRLTEAFNQVEAGLDSSTC